MTDHKSSSIIRISNNSIESNPQDKNLIDENVDSKFSSKDMDISLHIPKSFINKPSIENKKKIHIKENISLSLNNSTNLNQIFKNKKTEYLNSKTISNFLPKYINSSKQIIQTQEIQKFEIKKKCFYDVITNVYLIKKFISILMNVSLIRKPKFLNKMHYELIDDTSFYFDTNKEVNNSVINKNFDSLRIKFKKKKNDLLNKFKSVFFLILDFKVLNPFNYYLIGLNSINIFIYFIILFLVPLSFSFNILASEGDIGISEDAYDIMMIIIFLFYILDIIMNLNKAYYFKGELILDKKLIAIFYMKNYFMHDFLSLSCFFVASFHNYILIKYYLNYIFILFLFFKFKKLMYIFKQMEELFIIDQTYFNIYELIKLFTRIITIAHLAACCWFAITLSEHSLSNTWIEKLKIENSNWEIKYLYSFYYIIITMNTVGYGDITPQNPKEIVFCICFVFLACTLFAYCINCVGNIVKDIYQRESGFRADLFSINEFMRNKNINKNLQIRVRKYLEYIWKEEKIQNIEFSKQVINKLSSSLRSDLMLEANGPLISNIDLFTKNFSEKSLRSIIDIMKEERFTPGEIIFEGGNSDNHDMFIIKKGKVEVFVENNLNENKKHLTFLDEGKIFGEISFFSELERSSSIKSVDFTTLIRIDQQKFKKIIKENSEDFERYNHIKDSIRLYNKYDLIFIKCFACNRTNHLITNCPLLHRNFFHEIVIRKYNYSIFQERYFKSRKINKKTNALKINYVNKTKEFEIIFRDQENSQNEESNYYNNEISEDNLNQNISEIKEDDSILKRKNHCHSKTVKIDSLANLTQIEEVLLNENNENILMPGMTVSISGKTNTESPNLKIQKIPTIIQSFHNTNKSLDHTLSLKNVEDEKNITIESLTKYEKDINKKNKIQKRNSKIIVEGSIDDKYIKEEKEKETEINLIFDSIKVFKKYFQHNNADKIVKETNKKLFLNLKKIRKGHLFLSQNSRFFESGNKTIKTQSIINNSPNSKKNVLRKKSEIASNWKDELKNLKKKEKISIEKHSSSIWSLVGKFGKKIYDNN